MTRYCDTCGERGYLEEDVPWACENGDVIWADQRIPCPDCTYTAPAGIAPHPGQPAPPWRPGEAAASLRGA